MSLDESESFVTNKTDKLGYSIVTVQMLNPRARLGAFVHSSADPGAKPTPRSAVCRNNLSGALEALPAAPPALGPHPGHALLGSSPPPEAKHPVPIAQIPCPPP
jgi:hypothetical protein